MTLNKVLLVRVIHMTKQFWDKIGRFDADKYAENVLKLECYKSVHAVVCENLNDGKSAEISILEHDTPCLAILQLQPTHILPQPNRKRLLIGLWSGLVILFVDVKVNDIAPR